MATGASLEEPFLQRLLGGSTAGFCAVPYRMYPLARVVDAPKEMIHILDICADLVRGAVRNGRGNVLIFLPGMEDILRLRSILKKGRQRRDPVIQIATLHSDALGLEEDEQNHDVKDLDTDNTEPTLVYISSVIAARGVTLEDIRCVFIHPHCSKTRLY